MNAAPRFRSGAVAARPLRRVFQLKQQLAGFWHEQNSFVLAVGKLLGPDALWIAITEVDFFAHRLRNARRERDLHATFLDAVFKRADAAHMRRMREHTPRVMFELVPLLQEIIA